MIQSKADLRFYILEDKKRNLGNIGFLRFLAERLYGSDRMKAFSLLKALRKLEYSENVLRGKNMLGKIDYAIRKLRYQRLETKYNIVIGTNMVGYGFWMPHVVGGGVIINCNSMGNYCCANVGVLVGNNHSWDDRPTMGDNVLLTTGSKVIGGVKIGNNVIVAPNSVVVKDIPDNCVVSGVPAKIIKKDGKKYKED